MRKNKFKKGLVFTAIVFVLSISLIDLTSYLSIHNDRQNNYFLPPSDGEILNSKINEISWNSQRALGVTTNAYRNSSHLLLNYADSGFPFHPASLGRADLGQFSQFYSGAWAQENQLSCEVNPFYPNSTGIYYQTSDGINYSHINSIPSSDWTVFSMPQSYDFSSIRLSIYCSVPQNASSITYQDWSNSGTTKSAQIYFSDSSGNSHTNSVLFSQSSSDVFRAEYRDSLGNFLQRFEFKLQPTNNNILNISSHVNNSYGWFPLTKQNVSCVWSLSLLMNYSNSAPIEYYAPILTTISRQNSSYRGYLPIYRG